MKIEQLVVWKNRKNSTEKLGRNQPNMLSMMKIHFDSKVHTVVLFLCALSTLSSEYFSQKKLKSPPASPAAAAQKSLPKFFPSLVFLDVPSCP